MWQLWDTGSGNCLGEFRTFEETIAAVRSIEKSAPRVVHDLRLIGREGWWLTWAETSA